MNFSTNMKLLRHLSSTPRLLSKIDLRHEMELLHVSKVHDLPYHGTIPLSGQTYKTHHTSDETKTPLLMIHGLFGAKQNYSSVGKKISMLTGRKVMGVDMRNHGASGHAAPHTYMTMAHDTIEHIEKLGDKVVLAGHLMGAKVLMLVSLMRPELVEKLIVIDNSPVSGILDVQFTRDLVGMCHVERDSSLVSLPQAALVNKVDKVLAKYEKDPLVRVFLALNLMRRQSKSDGLPIRFRVPVLNFLKDNTLAAMGDWPQEVEGLRYDGPVKIMKGSQSNFVLPHLVENEFPKYFPNALLSVFDAGHWLVSEKPDQFVRETIAFLEEP